MKVRTKIRPDLEQEVDPREAYALRAGGLLVDDDNAPEFDPSQNAQTVDEDDRQRKADEAARQAQEEAQRANETTEKAEKRTTAKAKDHERS